MGYITYLPAIDFTTRFKTSDRRGKKKYQQFQPHHIFISSRLLLFFFLSDTEVFSRHEKCTFPESHTADFNYGKYFSSASSCEKIPASSTEKTQPFYLLLGIHHKCANILGLKGGLFKLSKGLINRLLFTEGRTACREYEFSLLSILI